MDFEGQSNGGLSRHEILALIVLGFVSIQTDRLRGVNPEVTREQVFRALNVPCAGGSGDSAGPARRLVCSAALMADSGR